MSEEAVFRKKKIAVVSRRKNVSDFLRLEAESCSCAVSVTSLVPPDLSEFDVVIVDDDGSYTITEDRNGLYRIVPDGAEVGKNSFSWPVSVSCIREIFEGYVAESPKSESDDGAVIYLRDGEEKSAIYKNRRIPLTESEWKLIVRLGQAEGEPVGRDELMELFDTCEGNISDVYICHLRRKLEEPFGVRVIRTVRGKGYSLLAKIKITEKL